MYKKSVQRLIINAAGIQRQATIVPSFSWLWYSADRSNRVIVREKELLNEVASVGEQAMAVREP